MRTIWEVVSKMYVGPFFEATPIVEGVFRCSEVGANNFPHRSHFFLISFSFRSQSAPVAIVRTLVVLVGIVSHPARPIVPRRPYVA
jgi:hypothetical protein